MPVVSQYELSFLKAASELEINFECTYCKTLDGSNLSSKLVAQAISILIFLVLKIQIIT